MTFLGANPLLFVSGHSMFSQTAAWARPCPKCRVSTGFFGLRYHKRLFPNSSWACIASILRIFCAMAPKHVAIIWPDNMHLKCTSYFPIKSSALGTSSSGHDIVQQPMPTRLTESTTPILDPRKGEGVSCWTCEKLKIWMCVIIYKYICVEIIVIRYIQTSVLVYIYINLRSTVFCSPLSMQETQSNSLSWSITSVTQKKRLSNVFQILKT